MGDSHAALLFELFTTITLKNKNISKYVNFIDPRKKKAKTDKSSPESSRESSPEENSPTFPIAKEG